MGFLKKHLIVLFGATGDLAKKKLIPALQSLYKQNIIQNIPILCIGRREISKKDYLNLMNIKDQKFAENIYYLSLDLNSKNPTKLKDLANQLDKNYNCKGNIVFYLSLPYFLFKPALDIIKNSEILKGKTTKKVVFEKPFGHDLKSAENLNKEISKLFKEHEIYRVDHYLGKELVENILYFRFANSIFENIWNNKFIDNVQIILSESIGIENRGQYYDKAGAIKDMVQNHILQVLSLIAMEAPFSLNPNDIRDQKVNILKNLVKIKNPNDIVIAQYGSGIIDGKKIKAYTQEKDIPKDSKIETFVALKTYINNKRWQGVPFYIKTGKRLDKTYSEVNLILKDVVCNLFCEERKIEGPNVISIRISPQEGIVIKFNAKIPGKKNELKQVSMEFCHACEFAGNTPEAYETVLNEVLKGDHTIFARYDEIKESWKFIDALEKLLINKRKNILKYKAGTPGPKEADNLLKKDNRKWVFIERRFSI
jgi:glucose-6-phosphate 1-dehydrogenase